VVIQNPSAGNGPIRLVRAWQPQGTQTVVWALDMDTGQPLLLVEWGNELYLPVEDGLRLGIGIYNGSSSWKAFPTFVEAANLWIGGPAQQDDCSPNHMWEIGPRQHQVVEALMNPDAKKGRPLTIVRSGEGFAVGEATFGTERYRGKLRVYERSVIESFLPPTRVPLNPYPWYPPRPWEDAPLRSSGFSGVGPTRSSTRSMGPSGGGLLGSSATYGASPEIGTDEQVGIGAGTEERRDYYTTGKRYRRDSRLVIGLQIESRHDLAKVLAAAQRPFDTWFWSPHYNDWFENWSPPAQPTAPHIPVAPHRPQGVNVPSGRY